MAIFDWRDFEETAAGDTLPIPTQLELLERRFESAQDGAGVQQWREFVRVLRELAGQAGTDDGVVRTLDELDRFVQALNGLTRGPRNTVFVSHQRANADWAERAAWEATKVGFEYWLDIHDLALRGANLAPMPPPIKAALIAGIIEMALLNCSHVVSMQTSSSRGSHWVPYEFGRAKQRVLMATQAASWFQTGVAPDPGGDYLSLAVCAPTKYDLVRWLGTAAGPLRRHGPNTIWKRSIPADLPN